MHTILTQCPYLVWKGLRDVRPDLLLVALDLAVPPLSLLVFSSLVAVAISCRGLAERDLVGGTLVGDGLRSHWHRAVCGLGDVREGTVATAGYRSDSCLCLEETTDLCWLPFASAAGLGPDRASTCRAN